MSTRRRIIILAAIFFLAATVVCASLVLGTARGRQALLDAISHATASPDFRLEMRELRLGTTWTLESLSLSDASGPWLGIESLQIRPDLGALFTGRIALDHLGMRSLDLDRLPAGGESTGEAVWPRLRIGSIEADRVRIGQAVAGHEALLSVTGGFSMDQGEARGNLHVVRHDRGRDRLDLEGLVRTRENDINLRLALHEEPGGLLHTLLAVNGTEGIDLSVKGQGTFQDVPLTLDARIADAATLAGNANVHLEGDPAMALHVRLSPGPSWTELTGQPRKDAEILAHGEWKEHFLQLSGIELRSQVASIAGNATWDSEGSVLEAAFQATAGNLDGLLPTTLNAGPASAHGTLRLDRAGLSSRIAARFNDWAVGGSGIPEASADISLSLPADSGTWQAAGQLEARTPDLPEGMRTWAANATLDGDASSVLIDRLNLDSERLGIALTGRLATDFTLAAQVELRDLPLSAAPSLSSVLTAALEGAHDPASGTLSATLDLNATRTKGLPEVVEELLGQEGRLTARFELAHDLIRLQEARLQARTPLDLTGEFDLASKRFTSEFGTILPELRRKGLSLSHGAMLRGTAAGTPDNFSLHLTAKNGNLSAGRLRLGDIGGQASLRGLPALPAVSLTAGFEAAGQPASLLFDASPAGKVIRITRCLAELPGVTFQASGTIHPTTLLLDGTAEFTSPDLRSAGLLLGENLAGALRVSTELAGDKGVQRIRLSAEGEGLSARDVRIGRAQVNGHTAWPGMYTSTELRVEASSAAFAALQADRIMGLLRGSGNGLDFDVTLQHEPAHTDISAHGSFAPSPPSLRIDTLQGTLWREGLRLESPLIFAWNDSGMRWEEAALGFGRARLSSRGEIGPQRADISAVLRDMDPAILRPLAPNLPNARINARLEVTGSPQRPNALLEVQADEIRTRTTGLGNLSGLVASAEARLGDDRLDAHAVITSEKDIALDAQLSCPVQTDLPAILIAPQAPLSGRIGGHTEIGMLPRLLRLDDQAMNGRCELDFRIGGTLSNPELAGSAHVRGGRYENFRSGTAVESADVNARATGSRLELNATATDGGEGKATGRGTVDLAALTYVFDVDLEQFRLLRLDSVRGTADGPFRFRGDLDGSALTGNLVLDPSTVLLPKPAAAEAPLIDIREIHANATGASLPKTEQSFLVGMDLNVSIPARLAVQGRGLDSEWSGRLHLGGDHVRPAISGEMHLLRGKFDFLDRSFDLTKGTLILSGENPPNPFLDMIGETQVLDTLVQVHLSGPARSFRLTLTSVPDLPQDELLAMILFGRSMREISPLQAVILAQAAAEMTGVGPNLDFIRTLKSRLGLQEVDVSKDDNDETAVGIGGYVGGKYYIRTQRSVSGQDRTKVEVQLTPKVSVETEVGADSRQGGGVTWKHDY